MSTVTDTNHYERAEDSAIRAELEPGTITPDLSAQLAGVYAQLATADLLASLVAAVDRLTNAVARQLPTSTAEVAQAALELQTADPAPAGACVECGTPTLLGHKLNCSGAVL